MASLAQEERIRVNGDRNLLGHHRRDSGDVRRVFIVKSSRDGVGCGIDRNGLGDCCRGLVFSQEVLVMKSRRM